MITESSLGGGAGFSTGFVHRVHPTRDVQAKNGSKGTRNNSSYSYTNKSIHK